MYCKPEIRHIGMHAACVLARHGCGYCLILLPQAGQTAAEGSSSHRAGTSYAFQQPYGTLLEVLR